MHPCMDAPTAADLTCHPDFQNVSRPITALGCSWVISIIPPPCRQSDSDQMIALCKWQLPGSLPGDQGCVSVMERGHVVEKIYDMQKVAGTSFDMFYWQAACSLFVRIFSISIHVLLLMHGLAMKCLYMDMCYVYMTYQHVIDVAVSIVQNQYCCLSLTIVGRNYFYQDHA